MAYEGLDIGKYDKVRRKSKWTFAGKESKMKNVI